MSYDVRMTYELKANANFMTISGTAGICTP